MKTLLWKETQKTLCSPVLIAFALLCIALNIAIVLANQSISYEEDDAEPYNVFEGYETRSLADKYVAVYGMTGEAEENIRGKYEKLQSVVDEKAAEDDALSQYLGSNTYYTHGLLFGTLIFAVTAESSLLALFAALMLTGYESTRNTEQLIFASRTGRKILRTKLAASIITGLAAFVVILAASLAVFFIRYDFSTVWSDNVSSSFNYAIGQYLKPFITWRSFTVGGLLLASIGVAAGLTAVFALLGFSVGTFFRSAYAACGAAAALCILQFAAPMLLQMGGTLRGVLSLTPVMLVLSGGGWQHSGGWFTDGGEGIVFSNYECIGLLASITFFAVACLISAAAHKRRELA